MGTEQQASDEIKKNSPSIWSWTCRNHKVRQSMGIQQEI